MRDAYDLVMRVLTEDHPALDASGGRLLARLGCGSRLLAREIGRRFAGASVDRLAAPALQIAGFALLGFCALAYLDMWIYQATSSLHLGLERLRASPVAHASGPRPEAPRPALEEGQSMGWIEIPRVGISAVVAHGVDDRTLRRAVGHIPGTAAPGEIGNVGLAGHRDTFFRALQGVRASDVIRLVTPDGVHTYRVEELTIVSPDRTDVLDPTPRPTLTLVTCYPFSYVGSAPSRYIVRARETDG